MRSSQSLKSSCSMLENPELCRLNAWQENGSLSFQNCQKPFVEAAVTLSQLEFQGPEQKLCLQFWHSSLFFCPSPLPFGGSTVLSLTRGPAGNRTTTGSLSATSRTPRYQLSHEDDSVLAQQPQTAIVSGIR